MKVGMNLLLWTGNVTENEYRLLPKIKEWGADGVEIPIFNTEGTDWKRLCEELDKNELECTAVTVLPPGANLIGDDAAERKAAVDFLKGCVDVMTSCAGNTICGPLYSPVGRLVGRGPTEDEFKRCVEGLHEAGEYAAKHNTVLGIEPLNRFETYFCNTQAQAARIVDAVGLKSVGQMYDTFHANIEEKDIAKAIETGGKRIVHVHISACDRGTPGDDHIDYATNFAAIKKIGYDGWLTIESFGHRIPELAGATCIWREVSPSEDYVVRNGIEFIRKAWGAKAPAFSDHGA
ncbi:MAG: sugar phosphate isomerase/epimerase [Candidatus Hydrogenedentes bacterium]|nr:sugar phosphate isomerase/epimerase [Candidatus Hydrogenedentota bacterium]